MISRFLLCKNERRWIKIKEELKLYVPERLKNRIKMIALERGISINKLANLLLENGLYNLLKEESKYGNTVSDNCKEEIDNEWYTY